MSKFLSSLRILSFNVNRKYDLVDVLLHKCLDNYDILFIQEPPWKIIRYAPSTRSRDGEPVVGAPSHPSWTCFAGPATLEAPPRVIAYVHSRVGPMRPSLRRDLVDSRDLMVISVVAGGEPVYLAGAYSDERRSAITLLADLAG